MYRSDKEAFVSEMRSAVDSAPGFLLVDFTGITVAEVEAFRGKLREASVSYRAVKNTLMTRVLAGTPYEKVSACLKGTPTAVVWGEDPVAVAKLTFEFMKDCEHLQVKGGGMDNETLSAESAKALSKMPGRMELLAEVVALAQAPASNLLAQIKSPAGRIVGAIDKQAEQGAQ